MVYVGLFFLLLSLVYFWVACAAPSTEKEVKRNSAIMFPVFLAISLLLITLSSITVVGTGNVGVPIVYGNVGKQVLPSGLNLVSPFSNVEQLSIQTENYWMSHQHNEGHNKGDDSVSVRSSNGLQMPVDVSVPYRLVPEVSPWVLQNLGKNYVEKVLRPSLSTATRRAASHYTAEELYSTKRDEFAERIKTLLEEELKKVLLDNYSGKNPPEQVIIANQVLVGHVGIPETVKNAIEAKLKADQEQQAMDFTIKREQKEAERKKVEAEGIRQFQEIVTKGIDDKLLRWKAIDATLQLANSHNTKIIIIGSGKDGLPVLLNSEGDAVIPAKK